MWSSQKLLNAATTSNLERFCFYHIALLWKQFVLSKMENSIPLLPWLWDSSPGIFRKFRIFWGIPLKITGESSLNLASYDKCTIDIGTCHGPSHPRLVSSCTDYKWRQSRPWPQQENYKLRITNYKYTVVWWMMKQISSWLKRKTMVICIKRDIGEDFCLY